MAIKRDVRSRRELLLENEALRLALEDAEETLRAIRSGEVDALVVESAEGERVFTLQGADRAYRVLIEEMNEGALNLTKEGMILYANRKFAELLNAPLNTVIGSSIHSWVTPECREAIAGLLYEGAQDKCRAELSLAATDGSSVPVYLSVAPVVMDGLRECLGAVALDLTEQKRAEEALRISEAKFRNVFQNASLGKVLQGMDGTIEVNSAILAMSGYTEEELRHAAWEAIVHPEDVPMLRNALNGIRDGNLAGARFEMRLIHKQGHAVWTDATMGLVKNPAGTPLYILISFYDITARKEADAAIQDLKQHLQKYVEAERLHLAQDLHDVPLQELYGILYRLEDIRPKASPQSGAAITEVIADVKATLSSLRSIATDLRPPATSPFGFEKAARTYLDEFRDKHPELTVNASLKHDQQAFPEETRLMLFRVLQEALSNIARHAHATQVKVRFDFNQSEACLEITDNGRGFAVPLDWASLARDRHYGLAGMAERMKTVGGTLSVSSAPGTPTTVQATLPYSALGAAGPAKKRSPRKSRN